MIHSLIDKIKVFFAKDATPVFVHEDKIFLLPRLVPLYTGKKDYSDDDDDEDDDDDPGTFGYYSHKIYFFSFHNPDYPCYRMPLVADYDSIEPMAAIAKQEMKKNSNFDYAQIVVEGNFYPDGTEVPDDGVVWDSREPTHVLVEI